MLSQADSTRSRSEELSDLPPRQGDDIPVWAYVLAVAGLLATLTLVLHHVPEPERALGEVARVLKPGGRVAVVDMLPHDRDADRHQMGHV